jgi:hypothetical protein
MCNFRHNLCVDQSQPIYAATDQKNRAACGDFSRKPFFDFLVMFLIGYY